MVEGFLRSEMDGMFGKAIEGFLCTHRLAELSQAWFWLCRE